MVIGGGVAGLTAAWELSKFQVNVELVEKKGSLGGHAIDFCCKATDKCMKCGACAAEKMLKNVQESSNITVHLATEVDTIESKDKFSVKLKSSADDAKAGATVNADAVIVASGYTPFDATRKPTYNYGTAKNVITGIELEKMIREQGKAIRPSDNKEANRIAFIQCVGSRDERLGNLWCSQVCCPYALRMAKHMKHRQPEAEISIFYMDIQNTGKDFSTFYGECKSDLRFVRAIPIDMFPLEGDLIKTKYVEENKSENIWEEFDLVVLSVGMTPGADNDQLSKLLAVELNVDGFFAPKSSLSLNKGMFAAGAATGPKNIPDSMAQARQAANEVVNYLTGGK